MSSARRSEEAARRPSSLVQEASDAPRDYRYVIEYFGQAGERLGPVAVDPDFQPAREWTTFLAARDGRLPLVTAAAQGRVSPIWSAGRGEPYCQGVRVDAVGSGSGPEDAVVSCEFPLAYFQRLAEKGSGEWIEKGKLRAGERYVWWLCAYAVAPTSPGSDASSSPTTAFDVESLVEPIRLTETRLDAFSTRARVSGENNPADFPVFLSQAVLDEACELAERAGEKETGGALVGHIHHDASTSEIFVEIVAQIPARYAEATSASFSFTAETWAAADATIALRGRHELILGFWHSHPRFCNPECPEERRRACPFAKPFFSSDDIHLHRVCFPQTYQIALLISDLPDRGWTPAVFGWRAGFVKQRGYSVLP